MADPPWLSAGGTPSTHQAASGPAFKVILIGDVGVGKTTLFSRIRHAQHVQCETRASATVGVDTCTRTVSTRRGNVTITLWDTAGAERYRTLTRNYYRSTHAALLVFSLDDPASLFNLPRWQRDVIESAPSAVQFLLGNKSDASREVTEQSMRSFADSHNCEAAFLTSARTGEGVEAALTSVCELLEDKYRQRTDTLDRDKLWLQGSGIHVHGSGQFDDKKGCC